MDPLAAYRKRRDFARTSEPRASLKKKRKRIFVVQRHDASHLHYDFRIEVGGVLKSWAVPKGVPAAPKIKRLAVQTEDHPLAYAAFEGEIPEGEYGAGTVKIWDSGKYYNLKRDSKGKEVPLARCVKEGRVEIFLEGERYRGAYALIHFKEKNWLLLKMRAKTEEYLIGENGSSPKS